MHFLDHDIAPLGMGCWPIGGPMFSGDQPLGYANSNDAESIRTIHAALASGITLFDTAAAYGAGHAERLLGKALKGRHEALIVTKIGTAIDEDSKQLTGDEVDPASVAPAIDRALGRLGRDHIDLLLLHQNDFPLADAEALFDEMENARQAGKILAYGWSTDFAERAAAVAGRDGFVAVEHAMNVLMDAPRMRRATRSGGLTALIRSPLAMGLLSGKYDASSIMPADDIRATANPKTGFFSDATVNPGYLAKLNAVREELMTGGRTIPQGALCWLWALGGATIPIPGARTVSQIEELADALAFGPLPDAAMARIEASIDREPADAPDRAR